MRQLFFPLFIVSVIYTLSAQPLSGVYTVGGSNPNYTTLQNAVDALLTNGVGGPVFFNLRAGVYENNGGADRALYIPGDIPGAAGNRMITFQADAASGADSSNVFLRRTAGPFDQGWVAYLECSFITFDNLTFEYAHSDTNVTGIQEARTLMLTTSGGLSNDSITVRNCRFISSGTSLPRYALFASGNGNNITIDNCWVERTALGITLTGYYTDLAITNNSLRRLIYFFHSSTAFGNGITVTNTLNALIAYNDIDYVGGYTGKEGIVAHGGAITIAGNRVRNAAYSNTPTPYKAISIRNHLGGRSLVINNMISNVLRSGSGITILGSDVGVYHNTVVYSPQGFSQHTAISLGVASDIDIQNNIFLTRSGGFSNRILQAASSASNVTLDHNLLYSEPFSILFESVQYDSLEGFQAAGYSLNSQSFLVEFVSDVPYFDVHLGYCSPGDTRLLGTAIPEVTSDFDGQLRHSQTPYMGADEASQNPAQIFTPFNLTDTNDEALSFASGDLDNDGDEDLAVVNNHASNGGSEDVSLFWNDGSGNFSGPNHIPMGTQPVIVKIYDIDQDGFADLLATTDHIPVICWGLGGGNFTPPFSLPDPGIYGRVTDIDYIVTSTQPPLGRLVQTHSGTAGVDSGWVSVCFYRNDRAFRYDFLLPYGEPMRAGMHPEEVISADFNNDGLIDVIVNDWLTNTTSVLIDSGYSPTWRGFTKTQELQVFSGSSVIHPNIAAADIDGDGDNDVILGEWSSLNETDSLVFLQNDGTGFFTAGHIVLDRRRPSETFSIFDYDADGDPDIVSASALDDIVLYLNNGIGQFDIVRGCQASEFGSTALSILNGDFNGDGAPDVGVLTSRDEIATMHNLGYVPPQTNYSYLQSDLSLPIIDSTSTSDTLLVQLNLESANLMISDVNLTIDSLYHTRDSDLIIILHHLGVTDTLVSRAGGNGQNFIGTRLDDAATSPIAIGSAPFTGSYQPEQPLSQFNGLDPSGIWVLEIYDAATGESGILEGWQLDFTIDGPTAVRSESPINISDAFELHQNYSNPFNPITNIGFTMLEPGFVELIIYDILGRKVATLINKTLTSGEYNIQWNGRKAGGAPVASGMYFYRLAVDSQNSAGQGFSTARKMLLIR